MADVTAHLGLPFILAAQAQKHVTHNEALSRLDALVQLSVHDRDLADPPGAPADGARYLIASPATGAWAGREGRIAAFVDGAWSFFTPLAGWLAWVADEQRLLVHDGTGWVAAQSLEDLDEIQRLSLFGLNTTADTANPLAARLNSALLTALYAADGGTGDMRLLINKEAAASVGSMVFQTNWAGRTELGLAGDDNFRIRVSSDGQGWQSPFVISSANGHIGLGTDNPQVPLHLQAGGTAPHPSLVTTESFLISADGTAPGFAGAVAGESSANRMVIKGTRSRGTLETPAAVADNDESVSLLGVLYDGSAARATAQITLSADGAAATGAAPQKITFWTGSTTSRTERLRITHDGAVHLQTIGTTAAGANAVLDAGSSPANSLLRSTSSLAYKREVEPVDPSYSRALLALQPIWYRSRAGADRPDHSFWGFAAEEVAAIDPRLVSWGYRDEDYDWAEVGNPPDGAEGTERVAILKPGARKKPDGVAYDRLTVHHHVLIRELVERVRELEARR